MAFLWSFDIQYNLVLFDINCKPDRLKTTIVNLPFLDVCLYILVLPNSFFKVYTTVNAALLDGTKPYLLWKFWIPCFKYRKEKLCLRGNKLDYYIKMKKKLIDYFENT